MRAQSLLILAAGLIVGAVGGYLIAASPAQAESTQVPAWLEVIQRACTSVGGLGTFAALIYVIRQFNLLGTQSDLVQKNIRASLDSQLYSRLHSFNKFIVDHDAEYDLLGKPFKEEDPAGPRARLHHLCDLGFTFYEQIYKCHARYGLLDTEDWEEWQPNMKHFFGKAYVRGYWAVTRERYAESFQKYADELVATSQRSQPSGDRG
jgi:hypothetical protein